MVHNKEQKLVNSTMNISFCGAGFLGIYQLGCAEALTVKAPKLLHNLNRFAGASSGSLVATLLAVKPGNLDIIHDSKKFSLELCQVSKRRLVTRFCVLTKLEEYINDILPHDAHKIATDRLFVSLTKSGNRKLRNVLVSKYESKNQLAQYLLASCYIPYITSASTKNINIEGEVEKYIDGGFTDNLPVFGDSRTITVSPFSGRLDICPRDTTRLNVQANLQNMSVQVNVKNVVRGWSALFPPNAEVLEWYYTQGYEHTVRFLKSSGYYEVVT